ncbi:MAG: hypothetical protein Tsb0021_17460 [Chlamydiales bacterium]
MSNQFNYDTYTWKNAFFWGNFKQHCYAARQGLLHQRLAHIFIAALEFLPVISQAVSLCETILVRCRRPQQQNDQAERPITRIPKNPDAIVTMARVYKTVSPSSQISQVSESRLQTSVISIPIQGSHTSENFPSKIRQPLINLLKRRNEALFSYILRQKLISLTVTLSCNEEAQGNKSYSLAELALSHEEETGTIATTYFRPTTPKENRQIKIEPHGIDFQANLAGNRKLALIDPTNEFSILPMVPSLVQLALSDEKEALTLNNTTIATSSRLEDKISYSTEQTFIIDWKDEERTDLCGSKYNRQIEAQDLLKKVGVSSIPSFGFTHGQILPLFSPKTYAYWRALQEEGLADPKWHLRNYKEHEEKSVPYLLEKLQDSVKEDILRIQLPLSELQRQLLRSMEGKTLILRSASEEDGECMNAGGNETIPGLETSEESLKQALATVISSFFSLQSFRNRSINSNPFIKLPLCSAIVMEQITEVEKPIVSGVMMTSQVGWSTPNEEGITHITAAWGFSCGTRSDIVCDEWTLVGDACFSSIRNKPERLVSSHGKTQKVTNPIVIREVPTLSDEQLNQLKNAAAHLESHYKEAMNVEFVIRDDQLFIVQVRPVKAIESGNVSYLDPKEIPPLCEQYSFNPIVVGGMNALHLAPREILFAPNLSEAETRFNPEKHRLVVVYTEESRNSHPAVNFASQDPAIPCVVLPFAQWKDCKEEGKLFFTFCPQTAKFVKSLVPLNIKEGLFFHPARLAVTIDNTPSLQGFSDHPTLHSIRQLLKSSPEKLEQEFKLLYTHFNKLFEELEKRPVLTSSLQSTLVLLKQKVSETLTAMGISIEKQETMRLAFFAGVLRQLIDQTSKTVVGAHSLSGIESSTRASANIANFVENHKDNSLLSELALIGRYGFDETVQNNWLSYLQGNISHPQLEVLHKNILNLVNLGEMTQWFSSHFNTVCSLPIEKLIKEGLPNAEMLDKIAYFKKKISTNFRSLRKSGIEREPKFTLVTTSRQNSCIPISVPKTKI